jgi:hypothetical protein
MTETNETEQNRRQRGGGIGGYSVGLVRIFVFFFNCSPAKKRDKAEKGPSHRAGSRGRGQVAERVADCWGHCAGVTRDGDGLLTGKEGECPRVAAGFKMISQ